MKNSIDAVAVALRVLINNTDAMINRFGVYFLESEKKIFREDISAGNAAMVMLADIKPQVDQKPPDAETAAKIVFHQQTQKTVEEGPFAGLVVHQSSFQHQETGGFYCVVGLATMESTGEPAVIYRSTSDGNLGITPAAEFFDGRFKGSNK